MELVRNRIPGSGAATVRRIYTASLEGCRREGGQQERTPVLRQVGCATEEACRTCCKAHLDGAGRTASVRGNSAVRRRLGGDQGADAPKSVRESAVEQGETLESGGCRKES